MSFGWRRNFVFDRSLAPIVRNNSAAVKENQKLANPSEGLLEASGKFPIKHIELRNFSLPISQPAFEFLLLKEKFCNSFAAN